jgi:hypothetical protein
VSAIDRPRTGLQWGLITLVVVSVLVAFSFYWLGGTGTKIVAAEKPNQTVSLASVLSDRVSRDYLAKLDNAAPETAEKLRREAVLSIEDGADSDQIAEIVLQAAFSQFQAKAFDLQYAPVGSYDAIIAKFSGGTSDLKAANSDWCKGLTIQSFLKQSDDELVPSLLSNFPYQSAQYDWVLEWSGLFLDASVAARASQTRHRQPNSRDEFFLQQEGLGLGSSQWGLALQIAAFANAEGQSFDAMQDAIEQINVCDLGIAVGAVSKRLPEDTRGRIWADLMPEIMVGNTPYALARIQDYFFIG